MSLTPEQSEMYEQFALEFQSCWSCGIEPTRQICKQWPARWLEIAHILGSHARTADRRNILRLCKLCHDLAHGHAIRDKDRKPLPNLSRENLLWLKISTDQAYFDTDYLDSISVRKMQPLERPPQFFFDQFSKWKGGVI